MQQRRRWRVITGALAASVLWSIGAAAGPSAAATAATPASAFGATGTAPGRMVAAPELCDVHATTPIAGGRYNVQNNRWGASTTQCIAVQGTGFVVTRAEHNKPTDGAPAAYPSIYVGCHYGHCTSDSGLPRKVSEFDNARGTYRAETPNSGAWNSSFDLWFDPTQRTNGQNTGAELMIWANHRGGPRPIGTRTATVTLEGAAWDVWVGNIGWNVISYVRQQPTNSMANFSVSAFVNDAVARGQIQRSWYLTSVQAGFEPWVGGTGLAVRDFAFTTNGTAPSAPAPATPTTPAPADPTPPKTADPMPTTAPKPATSMPDGTDRNARDRTAREARDRDARNRDRTAREARDRDARNRDRTAREARDRDARNRDRTPIIGAQSSLCLDVAGTDRGVSIQLWNCGDGSPRQGWTRDGQTLVNTGSGFCLDVQGASTANGARVHLWPCHGGDAQQWESRNGALINPHSGKCLDAGGGDTGARLQIWDCDGRGPAANQRWTMN
ncbi:MAG: GH12 family glycosyl hydrolase domain-containing protein [Dermatophilaceae bacterium]